MWHHHGIGDRKLIQTIKVISCYSLFSTPGGGAFSRDFTTNLAPRCKAFSRALTPSSFSSSVHSLLPKEPFKNIFDFTKAGDWG